eukprot:3769493-Amphidinium_carterae.1
MDEGSVTTPGSVESSKKRPRVSEGQFDPKELLPHCYKKLETTKAAPNQKIQGNAEEYAEMLRKMVEYCTAISANEPFAGTLRHVPSLHAVMKERSIARPPQWEQASVYSFVAGSE